MLQLLYMIGCKVQYVGISGINALSAHFIITLTQFKLQTVLPFYQENKTNDMAFQTHTKCYNSQNSVRSSTHIIQVSPLSIKCRIN